MNKQKDTKGNTSVWVGTGGELMIRSDKLDLGCLNMSLAF
jgi:hypothetical protein